MQERVRKVVLFGMAVLVFLAPLKFTQPVILYYLDNLPHGLVEWIFSGWPESIFYKILVPLAVIGLVAARWEGLRRSVWILPAAFLLTQMASTAVSVNPVLSRIVLLYFFTLAAGFLLGALCVKSEDDLRWLMLGWFLGALIVAWEGMDQATGGLQVMRDYLYAHPEAAHGNPEIFHKVTSSRIFSTFVTANALGDFVIVTVFILAALGWHLSKKLRSGIFAVPSCLLVIALLFCLWKTVSKGSYAVLFMTISLGVLVSIRNRKAAWGIIGALLLLAAALFAVGYGRAAVEKAKLTGGARLDYWRAAWKIGRDHPVLGTGPGTFGRMYVQYKRPEDEDTKLVHNNYLQMWCDSGLPGFIAFALWLPGTLWLWVRRWRVVPIEQRVVPTVVWCACVAFAIHSLMDFELYMVSNAWPVFVVMGWLAASTPAGRRQELPTSNIER